MHPFCCVSPVPVPEGNCPASPPLAGGQVAKPPSSTSLQSSNRAPAGVMPPPPVKSSASRDSSPHASDQRNGIVQINDGCVASSNGSTNVQRWPSNKGSSSVGNIGGADQNSHPYSSHSHSNNFSQLKSLGPQPAPADLPSFRMSSVQEGLMPQQSGDHRGEVRLNNIVGNGISGILHKWVNYGKGWRPRWFVLQDGVLSFYKIHGPDRIEVNHETEKGSKVIGGESMRRLSRGRYGHSHHRRKPVGEVHLKVSTIRESRSDDKRFSIFTGTKRLHLRADTREDRLMWMDALQAVKEMFPRVSNSELMAPVDNFLVSTEMLRKRLLEERVSDMVIQDCEQIVKKEFSVLQKQLVALKQKQLLLIDTLRQLETEKVDLENTLVDESQRQFPGDESLSRSRQEKYSEGSASESDDENERNDAAEEETDEDDNPFFDTHDFQSSSSFKSSASEFQRLSFDLEEDDLYGIDYLDDSEASLRPMAGNYPYIQRRKKLPDPVEKEKGVSLWSMIKDNIGKDLTKVCLPVYFNEPLSSLQKCSEDLEYSFLVDRAYEWGKKGNALMRILNVAAFAVSGYSSTEGRNCKPFNPLLGETYEAEYPDKGIRFLSEKVSHHPMVVACHCEGKGWKLWGDSDLKSKFWGRSIQLDPVGVLTLEFDDGEIFQWSKVTTSIYNLILGKLYCDHYGTMRIQGNREFSCKLKFKEQSIIDRNPHQVQGIVQDRHGKAVATLFGKWDESMQYLMGDCLSKSKLSSELSANAPVLWRRAKPSHYPTRYNLTRFAITLNELAPGLKVSPLSLSLSLSLSQGQLSCAGEAAADGLAAAARPEVPRKRRVRDGQRREAEARAETAAGEEDAREGMEAEVVRQREGGGDVPVRGRVLGGPGVFQLGCLP